MLQLSLLFDGVFTVNNSENKVITKLKFLQNKSVLHFLLWHLVTLSGPHLWTEEEPIFVHASPKWGSANHSTPPPLRYSGPRGRLEFDTRISPSTFVGNAVWHSQWPVENTLNSPKLSQPPLGSPFSSLSRSNIVARLPDNTKYSSPFPTCSRIRRILPIWRGNRGSANVQYWD